MKTMYEVNLWEDTIKRDETGKTVHHPLNSRYFVQYGKDTVSYGHLTFAGHDLDKSTILDDIKVFYLEFAGEQDDVYHREEWADPLRIDVLCRLTGGNRCWYLSVINRWFRGIDDAVTRITGKCLNKIEVSSEKPYGTTYGFRSREFFEVPYKNLSKVFQYFIQEAVPGYPIEGYNMGVGEIEVLKQWNTMPRDDTLFRDIIDRTFVNFYTFPAEHRYLVFVTNKLNYAELASLIRLEKLKEEAINIGRNQDDSNYRCQQ